MDWAIVWSAAGVVLTLGSMIFGCYLSLLRSLNKIDHRLSRLEGAFEERGRWESLRVKGE